MLPIDRNLVDQVLRETVQAELPQEQRLASRLADGATLAFFTFAPRGHNACEEFLRAGLSNGAGGGVRGRPLVRGRA